MDGSVTGKRRQDAVDEFNTRPSVFLFLLSTGAGGVGLNLTAANRVVIFDPSWDPSQDLQAQDRAYRLGQRRDVHVYRLLATGTVEEHVYRRQIYKQQQTNQVVYGAEEKRHFDGVKGVRNGELFGIVNLLRYTPGFVGTARIAAQTAARLGSSGEQQQDVEGRGGDGGEGGGVGGGGGGGGGSGSGRGARAPAAYEIVTLDRPLSQILAEQKKEEGSEESEEEEEEEEEEETEAGGEGDDPAAAPRPQRSQQRPRRRLRGGGRGGGPEGGEAVGDDLDALLGDDLDEAFAAGAAGGARGGARGRGRGRRVVGDDDGDEGAGAGGAGREEEGEDAGGAGGGGSGADPEFHTLLMDFSDGGGGEGDGGVAAAAAAAPAAGGGGDDGEFSSSDGGGGSGDGDNSGGGGAGGGGFGRATLEMMDYLQGEGTIMHLQRHDELIGHDPREARITAEAEARVAGIPTQQLELLAGARTGPRPHRKKGSRRHQAAPPVLEAPGGAMAAAGLFCGYSASRPPPLEVLPSVCRGLFELAARHGVPPREMAERLLAMSPGELRAARRV
ncbi:hypothetical protein Rsub_05096 [Raphidocelis subcapitata]|uniref:Helicase C-terminal domain-containing protein n=1 Tax=Raphidocelis subcapitata TaxID=307507 RepID=A0A2V0P6B7_9CHLO|nr:hypothetical protein Rsub_05096 [Raphidocelis subcapitata]|eukprot:GBF92727.1 hypothetical protein Rsub_05096 [Raphidocelis subcapitata]